jgi:WD40 repeat protein
VAAPELIKTIHIHEKYLYVGGQDSVIRGYNLEDGKIKLFEGHTSWVLCLETYTSLKEDGTPKS